MELVQLFQPLKGKHGRSDLISSPHDLYTYQFQPLKGKHGRSDPVVLHWLPGPESGFNPSKENTAVLTHVFTPDENGQCMFQPLKGKHGRSD